MHRKFCTIALTGLLTIGMAAGAAFAQDESAAPPPPPQQQQGMHRHHRMSPDRQLKRMTRQLNLSADQQSQIKPVLESRQQRMQALWQDQSLSRQDRRQKMTAIQQDTSSKIEAVLSDSQKQQYEAMQQKMRQHRMQHGQGGVQMPPPPDASSPQQQ